MDYIISTIAVISMVLILAAGWLLAVFSLPGTWLIVIVAGVYSFFVPDTWRIDVGWVVVSVVFGLAVLGEVIEALAGMLGASHAGGSKRSAFLALLGSLGGALLGGMLGLPIPLIGPVVAVVLGAAIGATAGAVIGEQWKGSATAQSWKVGKAAFWGRLLGTLGKVVCASIIVAIILMSMVLK